MVIHYLQNEQYILRNKKIKRGNEMKILDDFLVEVKKVGASKLAKASGVSAYTIRGWMQGRITPTLVNAQKVANAMGLEFLLFDKLDEE